MGDIAATILPRTAVKVALDAQGLYTGPTGERLEAALADWLDRAGYPRLGLVQPSGPDDIAFTGAAVPAGDTLWELAQQAATHQRAGAFGGAAASWPRDVAMPSAPPMRQPMRGLAGLGSGLSFEQKAAIGIGVALLGAAALGFGAARLTQAAPPLLTTPAEPTKKPEPAA